MAVQSYNEFAYWWIQKHGTFDRADLYISSEADKPRIQEDYQEYLEVMQEGTDGQG